MRIEKQKPRNRREESERWTADGEYARSDAGFFEIEENRKYQQRAKIERNERVGMNCVQAFIDNMSFSSSLEELLYFAGCQSLVDTVLQSSETDWTVPKWAKAGDIVLFMHTKTARSTITRLRSELLRTRNSFSPKDFQDMMADINAGLATHAVYGGKIFAIGRVSGGPEYVPDDSPDGIFHWKSRFYAEIDNITVLDNPVDISEFNSYITVTRGGAITPVWGDDYKKLKGTITKKNALPWFVRESSSAPVPLRKIDRHNWVAVANDYRRCFILESQFRSFYVDYLLAAIGDRRKFYEECRCTKPGINPSFIDNVFLFAGKYLAVEVKLSVPAEANINAQVNKYCYNSSVLLDNKTGKTITGEDMHPGKVLVMDTDWLYMYDAATDQLNQIFKLDNLRSQDDLPKIKATISAWL